MLMGMIIVGSSILSLVVFIPGHSGLVCGGCGGSKTAAGMQGATAGVHTDDDVCKDTDDATSKDARTESDVDQSPSASINSASSSEMSDSEQNSVKVEDTVVIGHA